MKSSSGREINIAHNTYILSNCISVILWLKQNKSYWSLPQTDSNATAQVTINSSAVRPMQIPVRKNIVQVKTVSHTARSAGGERPRRQLRSIESKTKEDKP